MLSRYASMQPSEFMALDYDLTCDLRDRVYDLHVADMESLVELAKGIMQSNGARLT